MEFTRRQFLSSAATVAALTAVARRGESQTNAVSPRGSAKACIFVNLDGAPSHLDTFDIKDASWNPPGADYRQYGPIVLSNLMFPRLSRHAGDLLLLKSVQSWEAAHERGQFYIQTAHPSNPAFLQETPHFGSVVGLELSGSGKLPPFLALNGRSGQGSTFLGGRYEAMAAPANPGGFSTIQHCCFGNQAQALFEEKYKLLTELERPLLENPFDPVVASLGEFYRSAKGLMYDPTIADVFRFSNEEAARYGNNGFGNACIVARNAIRANAGTRFVSLRNPGWDTHQNMFDTAYPQNFFNLARTLDSGIGPLLDDLKESGHLAETLVIIMGEFGRTPGPLNLRGGRDHHRFAMSVAMIGGGVKGGRVIGETDSEGDRIIEPGWSGQRPIYPEDIFCTLYSALGINWTKRILDTPSGRIFEYVAGSSRNQYVPVMEVFG